MPSEIEEATRELEVLLGDVSFTNPKAAAAVARLARAIAREEIASLAGLVLRRVQDVARQYGETGDTALVEVGDLSTIFGEALRDFGGSASEPGEAT